MAMQLIWNKMLIVFLIAVLTALVQGTHAQSYLLSLGQNQRNFFAEDNNTPDVFLQPPPAPTRVNATTRNFLFNAIDESEESLDNNTNTTIIVFKNIRDSPNDLSQSAMDIITVVWYVATFLALAAFFLLMACSDRRCSDVHPNAANASDAPIPPPTPSPSYSEFAPPSYESVIKMQLANKPSIFVIPFPANDADKEGANNTGDITPTTPIINFYTINELQKFSS